jgi:hypothetical protein
MIIPLLFAAVAMATLITIQQMEKTGIINSEVAQYIAEFAQWDSRWFWTDGEQFVRIPNELLTNGAASIQYNYKHG